MTEQAAASQEHTETTRDLYDETGRLVATESISEWPNGLRVTDRIDYRPDGSEQRNTYTDYPDGTHATTTYDADGSSTMEHLVADQHLERTRFRADGTMSVEVRKEISTDSADGIDVTVTEFDQSGNPGEVTYTSILVDRATGHNTTLTVVYHSSGLATSTVTITDAEGNVLSHSEETYDPSLPSGEGNSPPVVDYSVGGTVRTTTRAVPRLAGSTGPGRYSVGGGTTTVHDWFWEGSDGHTQYLGTTSSPDRPPKMETAERDPDDPH